MDKRRCPQWKANFGSTFVMCIRSVFCLRFPNAAIRKLSMQCIWKSSIRT